MAPPAKIDDKVAEGFVTPNFKVGSLFLKDRHGKVIRLAWEPVGEAEPAPGVSAVRPLPPGSYTLTGYRIVRRDDQGTPWFISAISAHGMRKIEIKPGQTQTININPGVLVRTSPGRNAGVPVTMAILGQQHAGLSIYKNGKRIPINYSITSPGGKLLETGKMKYG